MRLNKADRQALAELVSAATGAWETIARARALGVSPPTRRSMAIARLRAALDRVAYLDFEAGEKRNGGHHEQ